MKSVGPKDGWPKEVPTSTTTGLEEVDTGRKEVGILMGKQAAHHSTMTNKPYKRSQQVYHLPKTG